ncbi:ion channel protein [Ceratobasidium sp. AG-Ba]|nr:ion channel protein [Ceratobasidium sp. AG-Ba]
MVSYLRSRIHLFASIAPLTASLIAPLAVLLDIPALTGFSFGFSLIANVLLVVRFSLSGSRWRIATRISVLCWFVKVITGVVNLIVFGALTRNQPSFSYAEGFWSAVISVIASGIVLFLLLLHWAVDFQNHKASKKAGLKTPAHTKLQIRVAGRHFMLQNTMLIALIGLTALIFSKIENWSYIEREYFTTVTFLTIGFGDFYPTKPSTKVLLFPLALLGITLLAECISMIVSFFNKHHQQHKARARAEREKQWQLEQMDTQEPSLEREIEFLAQLHERQGWREQYAELLRSAFGFLTFWFVGAAIFGALESWSYGDALYFCYVFFLSVGYGDFAPISPAGRVIFIVYSLMAVPIMASFAVQAIQNIIERTSTKRMDKRRAEVGDLTSPEAIKAENAQSSPNGHTDESRDPENGQEKNMQEEIDEMHSVLVLKEHASHAKSEVALHEEDLKNLLEYAVSLERTARRLLVAHLEEGSRAQILLRADWNLQARDLRLVESERQKDSRNGHIPNGTENGTSVTNAGIAEGQGQDREEREEAEIANTAVEGMSDEDTIAAVREFRKNVAGMLALGSRMRKLEGVEKYVFERRRKEAEDEIRAYAVKGEKLGASG